MVIKKLAFLSSSLYSKEVFNTNLTASAMICINNELLLNVTIKYNVRV